MELEIPERYNVSTLLDRNLEAGRGDKVAIRCEDQEVTYAELLDIACRAGRALQALGVRSEQRVLMIMDDTPAWPAVFHGDGQPPPLRGQTDANGRAGLAVLEGVIHEVVHGLAQQARVDLHDFRWFAGHF